MSIDKFKEYRDNKVQEYVKEYNNKMVKNKKVKTDIWTTGNEDSETLKLAEREAKLLNEIEILKSKNRELSSQLTNMSDKLYKEQRNNSNMRVELEEYVGQIAGYERAVKQMGHIKYVEDMVENRRRLEEKRRNE